MGIMKHGGKAAYSDEMQGRLMTHHVSCHDHLLEDAQHHWGSERSSRNIKA